MKYSTECISNQLDIFQLPALDTSIEEGGWFWTDQVVKNAQQEVIFQVESSQYLDLTSCMLYVSLRVQPISDNNTITDLDNSSDIGLVNNFLHSLWKTVSVKIDDVEIDSSSSLYAYKDYILKLLNTGHEEQNSIFGTSLFYKDTAGEFENFEIKTQIKQEVETSNAGTKVSLDASVPHNAGFIKRRKLLIDGGGRLEMMGQLQCDLFNSHKFLLPNTKLQIKLYKNDDSFCILGNKADNYKIILNDVKLRLREQKVSTQVQTAHLATLLRNPATYHIKETEVKCFKPNTSGAEITQEICDGKVPNYIILGLTNFSFKKGRNPFNFQNFKVKKVELRVGNIQLPYRYILNMNYSKNYYLNGYISLFDVVNKPELGNNITREEYPNGYALYAFNLQHSINCAGDYISVPRKEKVVIKIEFDSEPEEKVLDLICYLEYDKILQLDADRKVIQ